MTTLLEMRGVTKRFGGVAALSAVDLTVEEHEIHALVGENGAGKTTLMNVLYGLYRADAGTIRLRGREARIGGPRDAIRSGIGMIHQHFMLVPPLTIAENVVLGDERSRFRLDRAALEARVRALSDRFGLAVDPGARVEDVPLGMQQRVEILKVLYRGSDLLILDEPTAVLTPQEVDELFVIIRRLRDDGKTIILITHKLREVLAATDRITVLRAGANAGELVTRDTTAAAVARAMVGHELAAPEPRASAPGTRPVLEIRGLTARSDRGTQALRGVDLTVHEGEVLGVAGVGGNGQSELAQCLIGTRRPTGGTILIDGADITRDDPRRTRGRGVAYVPEDRRVEGVVLQFSIAENLMLGKHRQPPYARRGVLDPGAIRREALRIAHEFDVRPPDPEATAGNLSGGNLQKVVLGRELAAQPRLVIASQPTRGLDIAATEFVHARLLAQRAHGAAILLVSSELDEIRELSDRIAVMYEGRLVALLAAADATEERLGLLMAGQAPAA